MTQKYVVGFLFSADRRHVALIRKNKPAWQAGKLNGVGGKIEPGEAPYDAMVREFAEETGITVFNDRWKCFSILTGEGFEITFYVAFSDEVYSVQTMEAEVVEVLVATTALASHTLIPNLKVMIPLALDQTGIARPVAMYDERAVAA